MLRIRSIKETILATSTTNTRFIWTKRRIKKFNKTIRPGT